MVIKDLIDFDISLLYKENKISKVSELREEFECIRSPFEVSEGHYAVCLMGKSLKIVILKSSTV